MIHLDRRTKRILYAVLTACLFVITIGVLLWIYRTADGIFQFALLTFFFLATCLFIYQRLRAVFYDSPVTRALEALSNFFHSADETLARTEEMFGTADHAIELMHQLSTRPSGTQELVLFQEVANLREEWRDQVERSRREIADMKSAYASLEAQITELGWRSQANVSKQHVELQRFSGLVHEELEQMRSEIPSDTNPRVNKLSQDVNALRQQMEQVQSFSIDEQGRALTAIRANLRTLEGELAEIKAKDQAARQDQPPGPLRPGEDAPRREWFWYKYMVDCTKAPRFTHEDMAKILKHSPGDVRNQYSEWRQIHMLPDPEDVYHGRARMPDKPQNL